MPALTVTKDDVKKVLEQLKGLTKHQVLVGVPENKGARTDADKDHINNAALAAIHNNGSPANNIPARPYLYEGVDDAKEKIVNRYKTGAKAVLDGKIKDVDVVHAVVGQVTVDAVKKRLLDGPWVPLAPSTLAARKRKGFKGTKPLSVTGQLRNATTFVIRDRKK